MKNTMTIKEVLTQYENVSIRKVAEVTNVTYTLLLKASKNPIPGEVYKPSNINYDDMQKMFDRRNIDLSEIDWEVYNVATRNKTAKTFEDFKVNDEVYLRENNETPFVIIYKTETHVVLMLKGSTEPRSLNANTFLLKGPSFVKRTVTNNE